MYGRMKDDTISHIMNPFRVVCYESVQSIVHLNTVTKLIWVCTVFLNFV